ncbi:MAG TPA: flavin reductase family protein [Pirellulaceae bacterium]|nr:flavin reductase family protein [Pirellulaceae bacterium]
MADPKVTADSILRQLTREVWVVTAATDYRRGGLTATWVHPVSLDPQLPLLLAAIAPNHFTAELVDEAAVFVAHLLADDQQSLAIRFALKSGRDTDKFEGLEFETLESGAPLLGGCVAALECRVLARLATGDRTFYWGAVVRTIAPRPTAPPLVDRTFFGRLSTEDRAILFENLQADLAVQRPAQAAWFATLPESLRPTV